MCVWYIFQQFVPIWASQFPCTAVFVTVMYADMQYMCYLCVKWCCKLPFLSYCVFPSMCVNLMCLKQWQQKIRGETHRRHWILGERSRQKWDAAGGGLCIWMFRQHTSSSSHPSGKCIKRNTNTVLLSCENTARPLDTSIISWFSKMTLV